MENVKENLFIARTKEIKKVQFSPNDKKNYKTNGSTNKESTIDQRVLRNQIRYNC